MHILGAIAEFERGRIQERVRAGLARAGTQGKRLGRPRKAAPVITVPGGSVRAAARAWGVSKSTAARWITAELPRMTAAESDASCYADDVSLVVVRAANLDEFRGVKTFPPAAVCA
jgi:DNA invertase Pin-like site-specific DNA recombinase